MINNYYLIEDGQQTGPFTHIDLMERGVLPDTLLLSPISNDWHSAAYLPEFNDYFQSQGIYLPTSSNLASFWWRLLAYIIDYILHLMFLLLLGLIFGLILKFTGGSVNWDSDNNELATNLLAIIIFMVYHAGFEATRMQGSIGKIVCRLKVVNVDGGRIDFPNALGRNLAKILSSLVLGIGFLSIFWNKQRQGWHDEMAKTYVVRTN